MSTKTDDIVKKFCTSHPLNTSCVCYNTANLVAIESAKQNSIYNQKFDEWRANDDAKRQEFNARVNAYNDSYNALSSQLDSFKPTLILYWNENPDDHYSTNIYEKSREYYDGWGVSYKNIWTFTYREDYKNTKLLEFKNAHDPSIISPYISSQPPTNSQTPIHQMCCSNSINAGESPVTNVLQTCNQTIVEQSIKEASDEKEKKRADKVAAQEAAANDEAKKNNEIAAAAAAKKTKNFYSSYISYSSYTYISRCCHICSFKKLIINIFILFYILE